VKFPLLNRRFAIMTYAFGLLIAAYASIFMQRSVWMWSILIAGLICMGLGLTANWYKKRGQPPTAQTWRRRALTWLFSGAILIFGIWSMLPVSNLHASHIANGLLLVFLFGSAGMDMV
jgi:hypothetical protein